MPRFTVLETSALFSNRVKYDYLFELEMWLKGLERFFQIDCLPLSPFERSHASLKNYAEEVAAARSGVAHMAAIATQLLGEGQEDLASFLLYLDTQVARGGNRRRGDGATELARVVESLDDFSKILDEIAKAPFVPLQTYLSLGRIVVGALRQDPNLGVLFRENLKPVLDRESKQSLAKVLGSLPDPAQRGALATLFVALFKGLRVAERASTPAEPAATRKRALLVFSLLKAESDSVVAYLRRRLRPGYADGSAEAEGLDRLAAAFEAEMRKVMDVDLVGVALMKDPDAVHVRLEEAAALVRDLYQQSVIGLAETFSAGLDARALFPEYRARADQSLRLREELGHLVRATQEFVKAPDRKTLRGLVTEIFARRAPARGYARVFACGPMPMFAALASVVAKLELPAEFSTEAQMGCGFGACLACVIPGAEKPFVVSCTEGPILPPEKIRW